MSISKNISRKITNLTFAEHPDQGIKCWVSLSGCNFNCKACFASAKEGIGRDLSVDELINLIIKASKKIYGKIVDRVDLTGGEPLLNKEYLLDLMKKLREISIKDFELSTNGFLLDEKLLEELSALDINLLIKIDLKAYTDEIHKEYTGKSNKNVLNAIKLTSKYAKNLHKRGIFIVRTVFMPDIFGYDEIEKISKFLSEVDKNVCYRLQQFSPVYSKEKISRRPTFDEMLEAYNVARKYLENVIVSTYLPTRPEYNYVEIRADELKDVFNEIDNKSKQLIKSWRVKSYTMNEILS
ncbi:MAG: radical SAM protein [Candidatus Altarchaeaceae archaeon]